MIIIKNKIYDYHKDHSYGKLNILLNDLIDDFEKVQIEFSTLKKCYDNEHFKSINGVYLDFIICNKDNCNSCPHGLYWYQYIKSGSRKGFSSLYIGKNLTKKKANKIKCATNLKTVADYNNKNKMLHRKKNEITKKLFKIQKILQ